MTALLSSSVAAGASAAPSTAFSDSLEMLCTVRFDGHITEANASLLRALGYDDSELVGSSSLSHVHPEDHTATLAGAAALLDGADVPAFENRYRCRDGSYRWLAWSARSDVAHGRVHCAARDVTESRRHRDLVDELLAELERSNTDLAQFAYVASHDLSEPLRMVSSYVQLLASRYEGRLDDDADEFIGYVVDGAARMKALIDDLLAYSRAGVDVAVRRRVDCGALVRSAVADLEQAMGATGASISVGDLPVVDGDPGQLSQLFLNLLSNALKFVAADVPARVRVTAHRRGDAWCFSVADNGIGIAAAHRERVFLMFKRLHGRTEYPGTGIGLALCHKIVTRFGGNIWLADDTEQGSEFLFTVPDLAPAMEVGLMSDDIQILLVEDNPGDVRLTMEALRGARVANELHVVCDGEEAIEFLHQRGRYADAPRPDIVLLDLNLPRLDGTDVLAQIKSDPDLARIPIIVLTSSSAEADIQRSYELHANCFISKPVDFTEFLGAVRSLEGFWLKIVKLPTR